MCPLTIVYTLYDIYAAEGGARGSEAARRARKLQASLLEQLQPPARCSKLVRPASSQPRTTAPSGSCCPLLGSNAGKALGAGHPYVFVNEFA